MDFLAKAEILDFQKAREEVLQAQADLRAPRTNEALDHLRTAWNLLEGIRFYQNLLPEGRSRSGRVEALRKTVKLGNLKSGWKHSRSFGDVAEDLRAYLEIEDSPGALGELETLLKARDLIDDKARSGVQDLDRLTFRLALRFKQNRFREVVQSGQVLTQSFLVSPMINGSVSAGCSKSSAKPARSSTICMNRTRSSSGRSRWAFRMSGFG